MAQHKAGKGKGGGTHSRSPRKRTRTTLEAGGMLSPTIPRRLVRELAKLRKNMQAVAGRTTAGHSEPLGERPECLVHRPPCVWIGDGWVSDEEFRGMLGR